MTTHDPVDEMLLQPTVLAAELGQSNVIVVDCRFNLLEPDAGRLNWEAGHIPGAFYADLDQDLAGPVTAESGRHPLPDPEKFGALLGSWGVTPESLVVAYDDVGGAIAARLWWLLRWAGHQQAGLLDGGLRAWLAQSLPLTDAQPMLQTDKHYPIAAGSWPVIQTAAVVQGLDAATLKLLDARDAQRFAGQREPIDPKAGHIPGAINLPFSDNLDADGRFRSSDDLRQMYATALGSAASGQVASMCGSGVTACHNLFALELSGLFGDQTTKPALYCGSWSEWIRSGERPIATGNAD